MFIQSHLQLTKQLTYMNNYIYKINPKWLVFFFKLYTSLDQIIFFYFEYIFIYINSTFELLCVPAVCAGTCWGQPGGIPTGCCSPWNCGCWNCMPGGGNWPAGPPGGGDWWTCWPHGCSCGPPQCGSPPPGPWEEGGPPWMVISTWCIMLGWCMGPSSSPELRSRGVARLHSTYVEGKQWCFKCLTIQNCSII